MVGETVEANGEPLVHGARGRLRVVNPCYGRWTALPTGNRAILGREQESIARELGAVTVEHRSGRAALRASLAGWDRDRQGNLRTVARVERRDTRIVVRDPHRAGWARRDAPRILQAGIGKRCRGQLLVVGN